MSDTPRTDADAKLVYLHNCESNSPLGDAENGMSIYSHTALARTLERELSAARSETITARVRHLNTMRQLAKAKDALRLIRDIGGTNHPEFAGLQCDGMWCARQARRALESIDGDK